MMILWAIKSIETTNFIIFILSIGTDVNFSVFIVSGTASQQ